MNPMLAVAVLAAVLVLATALGLVVRRVDGRVRWRDGERIAPTDLREGAVFGSRVTLVQFSTEFCAPCAATHRLLSQVAAGDEGIRHLDVDLTHRSDLASRFNIMQTPTTLVLDARGVPRARISGAPRRDELVSAIRGIGEDRHVRSD